MRLRIVVSTRVQHEALLHRELRGNNVVGGARRCKWDERQDWHASRCRRAGHKTLPRLVPTQGEQDFLTLSDSSKRGFPNALPARLKKNRHLEILRAGYSLKHQEGLHFQAMICAVKLQRELLLNQIWHYWAVAAIAIPLFRFNCSKSLG